LKFNPTYSLFGLLSAILSSTVFSISAVGQDKQNQEAFNPIETAMSILSISPDARSSGMGDMGVATSPDANSQHWNPAKYPFLSCPTGGSISYVPWLRSLVNDVSISYLAIYHKFDENQCISASLRYFSLGDMKIINEERVELQTVSPNELALDASYSRKFGNNFSIGLTLRYMRSDLTGGYKGDGAYRAMNPANAFGADVGFYYRKASRAQEYSWGLCIANLGTKVSYTDNSYKYPLPMVMRLGGAYTYHVDEDNSIMAGVEINKLLVPTRPVVVNDTIMKGYDSNVGLIQGIFQSFYDSPFGWREELSEYTLGVGGEYAYRNQFFCRAGYYHDSKRKGNHRHLTFGAGMRYSFLSIDVSYYYPFTNNDPLTNSIKLSVLFNFE
jgi:hypothetical protein